MSKKSLRKIGIVSAIVILLAASTAWLVKKVYQREENPSDLVQTVEKVIPLPAAVVGKRNIVSLYDLRRNLEATRQFYEGQDFASIGVRIDFNTEEGRKKLKLWERTILDKLIEDQVVMILAEQVGIKITDAQARARVNQELNRSARGNLIKKDIKRLWGFTLDDFTKYIVKPQLYRERLAEYAADQQDLTPFKRRILEAQSALSQGTDFATVARQYSDAADAATGEAGQARWFKRDELTDSVAKAVFETPVGTYTDVIETPTGFNVVLVQDRKTIDGEEQVLLKNIVVFKPTFADWLDKEIRKIPVKIFLKDYYWNTKTAHVAFANEELRKFAEKIAQNGENGSVEKTTRN